MASGKYEYYSQKLLNALFNAASWTIPTTLYLALYTTAPTVSTTGTEATSGSYARVSVTCNTTNWPTISGSTTTMTSGAAFTYVTATADWSSAASMVAAGVLDALTSGNLYYWGALTASKPVLNGDTASFASTALTISEL
jgi:hypothetical protein